MKTYTLMSGRLDEYTSHEEILAELKKIIPWWDFNDLRRLSETNRICKMIVLRESSGLQNDCPMFMYAGEYRYKAKFMNLTFRKNSGYMRAMFFEYYNKVHDDVFLEDALKKFKLAQTVYYEEGGKVREAHVSSSAFTCEEDPIVKLELNPRNDSHKFSVSVTDILSSGILVTRYGDRDNVSLNKDAVKNIVKSRLLEKAMIAKKTLLETKRLIMELEQN